MKPNAPFRRFFPELFKELILAPLAMYCGIIHWGCGYHTRRSILGMKDCAKPGCIYDRMFWRLR